MKISNGTVHSPVTGTTPAVETPAVEPTVPARAPAGAGADALQSSVLQPALSAVRDMPEIDQVKVAALREQLAKGEIPFNPAKLAGLIERFHRSK
ncbi:flagellar biosynthesis anti-sigma factor FlgM [Herbaspirillum sp. HC18]|nr:flagellar biosynthesis anti-sigma factor FlgM [Herbaspirillum sp. HC18]